MKRSICIQCSRCRQLTGTRRSKFMTKRCCRSLTCAIFVSSVISTKTLKRKFMKNIICQKLTNLPFEDTNVTISIISNNQTNTGITQNTIQASASSSAWSQLLRRTSLVTCLIITPKNVFDNPASPTSRMGFRPTRSKSVLQYMV